jgi:hypothetical protein
MIVCPLHDSPLSVVITMCIDQVDESGEGQKNMRILGW